MPSPGGTFRRAGDGTSGVFVTGTGTDVGKTVVAAAIARTFASEGKSVAVFKPAVTGLDDLPAADHEVLRVAARSRQSDEEIAPYRYGPPASPNESPHASTLTLGDGNAPSGSTSTRPPP